MQTRQQDALHSLRDTGSILIVEDDEFCGEIFSRLLNQAGYHVTLASSVSAARKQLPGKFKLCLVDLGLPDASGIELLRWIRRHSPRLPCIVISSTSTVPAAVSSLKSGASDFLVKPVEPDTLLNQVNAVMGRGADEANIRRIPWQSLKMRNVQRQLDEAVNSRCPVMLTGSPGSGKRRFARWLHKLSPMAREKLHICRLEGREPADVLEELFGKTLIERNDIKTPGALDRAAGSSLILDSLEHLPESGRQALADRLERTSGPASSLREPRLISTSTLEPEQLLARGFRVDLAYYLSPILIKLPNLDEIPEDIENWTKLLLTEMTVGSGRGPAQLTPDAWRFFRRRSWPGNLPELRRVLEGAFATSRDSLLGTEDLAAQTNGMGTSQPNSSIALGATKINELEKLSLLAALEACEGNRRCVAERLGVSLRSVYNMIKRHRIVDR